MKKIIYSSIFFLILIFIIFIGTLSTIGIETSKFNKLISNKISQTQKIDLKLKKIKFKLDLKELSLFLETFRPIINYKNIFIPVQAARVYTDFASLTKTDLKIKKINLKFEELEINQLKEISRVIKPSNFKSFLTNRIKNGKIISDVDIFLNKEGKLNNYIAKGSISSFEATLLNDLKISNMNFSFFADKDDILIKNIFGNISNISISNGDIKLNMDNGIKVNSNFNSELSLNENSAMLKKVLEKNKTINKIKISNGSFNNIVSLDFDETYKVKDYSYRLVGKIKKSNLILKNSLKSSFLSEEIKELFFSDVTIDSNFSLDSNKVKGFGNYSLDNLNFLKFNLDNFFYNDILNLKLDFDFNNSLDISLINYKKPQNLVANLSLDLEKKSDNIKFKKLNYLESKKFIKISDLNFNNNEFQSFKKIEVKTLNNDFTIRGMDKILITGKKFDARNFIKDFKKKNDQNKFRNISKDIEIDFKNIKVPMSEKLENFKLIGEIKNGKFVKISSKGDFGGDNYLDISMKKDEINNTKYLEVYSDLTRPLLTEYDFFKGLSGGKLLFTSLISGNNSNSKLKIDNFKVVNAPGMIKLLSLADLSGLEDLAKGEGLSFEVLEINMEKNDNFLKLNEIIALGPSMSVIMEGYQDEKGLTSLRGTLVPAKTLNKMISKIPLIGDILIPKEIGEGLFGVSFKIKGPKGKTKTTINPIRTLTPRFIQKIVDRNKKEIK
tara:strand:+ start:2304 stop:4475 length:2172 start_codon:yes stop_codon:yes gene_type:complete